jgi:hypothetical protein
VPGSLHCYGAGYFWHSLASVTLEVGGVQVRHAVHHATPFARQLRADQNELVIAMLAIPRGGLPTLVGADWNTECADRVRDEKSGKWVLYEPADPFAGTEWFDGLVYHCEWDYDSRGQRRHWADPGPGMCSGPADCTTPRPRCARPGTPRSVITWTTRTGNTGSGAASTRSA